MSTNLGTTNLLLGIMAGVSVLEALLILGAGVAVFMVYRRVMALNERVMNIVEGIEARQVAPAMARVNAILDDVKMVSTKVKDESERVDRAIRSTIDRVDTTADRVRSNVRANTSWLVGAVRGLRVVIDGLMNSERRTNRPPSDPTERVM